MQIILIEDLLHIFTLGKNFTIMHNNYNIQNKSRLHWIFNFLKWFSSDAPGSNEKYTLKCFRNKDKHRTKIRAVEFKRTIRCEKGSKKTCLIILSDYQQISRVSRSLEAGMIGENDVAISTTEVSTYRLYGDQ